MNPPIRSRIQRAAILVGLAFALSASAPAVVIPFVSNPGGNSSDFATSVLGLGGSITTLDFESHPTGPLNSTFYPGVTLNGTGNFADVTNSAGPGQGNNASTPTSSGEGLNDASNIVLTNTQVGSLTVTFDSPVLGFGLFTIDLFNPFDNGQGRNDVTLELFDGINGTGTSLGLIDSADFNFQNNFRYFMGAVSTASDIRSVVFTSNGGASDILALDDFQIASGEASVPEPSTLSLLGLGALALVFRRSVRRR